MAEFDPFTATLAEAMDQPGAFDQDRPNHLSSGPLRQWQSAQDILKERDRLVGDPLVGIAMCAHGQLTPPKWLYDAYLRDFDKVLNAQVRTWDEAFGSPFPKNAPLGAIRRANKHRDRVCMLLIRKLTEHPTRPVNKQLWEEIGEEVGEGATNAEKLYRDALKAGMSFAASIDEIRQFAVKDETTRPASSTKPPGGVKAT